MHDTGRTTSPRFTEALAYAAELHAAQRRKGTSIPYIAHLLAVSSLVLEDGGDEDEAIAGLLHDALEDQPHLTSHEELVRRFGVRVADVVRACSDAEVQPKPPWKERKEAYLAHLEDADASVLRVSNADKLHNAQAILRDHRELGGEVWSRFSEGREQQAWYYRALADVFSRRRQESSLAAELEATVSHLFTQESSSPGRTRPLSSAPDSEVNLPSGRTAGAGVTWKFVDGLERRPACTLTSAEVPGGPGVYVWYFEGRAMYVGKATGQQGLRQRAWSNHMARGRGALSGSAFRRNVAEHLSLGRPAEIKHNPSVLSDEAVEQVNEWIRRCEVVWIETDTADEALALEKALKSERLPPLTKQ